MANTVTIGPFETEYKKFWPQADDDDLKEIKRHPDHREFIFEQLLKIKYNIGEYKLKNNPDYNPNVPVTQTSNLFFMCLIAATVIMLFMVFVR